MDLAEAALDDNQGVVAAVQSVAAELEATPAQVALAWLLAQGRNLWCTQSGWSRHRHQPGWVDPHFFPLSKKRPIGVRQYARGPGTAPDISFDSAAHGPAVCRGTITLRRSVHPRLMLRERCSSAPTSYRSRTRRLQGIPGRPSRQRSGSRKRALGHFRRGRSAPSRQQGPLWICAAGTIRALEPAAVTKRARPASRIPTLSSTEIPPVPWRPASGYPSGNWSPITSSPEGGRYPLRTARPSFPT